MEKNKIYDAVYFSGSGFYMLYQYGVIKCFQDNNITFKEAYGVSGGVHASMALLGVTHLETSILNTFDLRNKMVFYTWNYFFERFREIVQKSIVDYQKSAYLHICVYDVLKQKRVWLTGFTSKDDLIECSLATCCVFPFLKIFPWVYKRNLYIDAQYTTSIPDTHPFLLWVSPFKAQNVKADLIISNKFSILACLDPSKQNMKEAFVAGYNDALQQINDPVSIDPNQYINQLTMADDGKHIHPRLLWLKHLLTDNYHIYLPIAAVLVIHTFISKKRH
jgi:drug/metabolite transporter superfamily protein YnfA